jgi:hypothetical protein
MIDPRSDVDRGKIDHKIAEDYQASEKKKRAALSKTRRKARFSRKKKKKVDDEETENGFHFIAYVPAGGSVWKMDGMERLPRKLGDMEVGSSWLTIGLADLHETWEKAMDNSFEVSLLSLVERTDFLGVNKELQDMEQAREDWGPLLTTLLQIHAAKGDLKNIMEGT